MITKKDLSVLFIVQSGKKYGIGHLKRALKIAEYYTNSFLWVLTDLKETESLEKILAGFSYQISNIHEHPEQKNIFSHTQFNLIITDCDHISPVLVDTFNKINIPMISLDNPKLGKHSEVFIAPLPSNKKKNANFKHLYHSPINEEYFNIEDNSHPHNILVSLGGSDPHNNAQKIVKALKDTPYSITVIAGPLSNYNFEEYSNVKIIENCDNLVSYIKKNDIIFCGPGSTMLEAMVAQKKIIVVAHTWSQVLDLRSIPSLKILFGLFATSNKIKNAVENAEPMKLPLPENFHFETWWISLTESIANRAAFCPLCGSHNKTALLRTEEFNRFRCNNCESSYAYSLTLQNEKINDDEIIGANSEQSQQSYKVAVLEQKEDSQRRIKIIKQIMPTPSYHSFYKLLDIGANHGIFVQEASHNGFSAQGVELAGFARRIALDNNIEMFDSMDKLYATTPIYHIITIWNKLELLENPLAYLQKITKMIPQGGMLAMRMPVEESINFSKGYFRVSLKGGELLAKRAGLIVVQTTKYTNNNKEYIEFYCIKKGNL